MARYASTSPSRPFVKWAGGKGQLLDQFGPHLPPRYGTYHEPFLGGGALFFHLRPQAAVLSDTNARLVRTWRAVRDDVDGLVALLRGYPHDADFFYAMRDRDIDTATDTEVAAWFIYLNKTGFNGLYRVNRKDRFNVPWGRYTNPRICDEPNLRACAAALRGVDLRHEDFTGVAGRARPGDLVYFDPPYVPLSATASFTAYTGQGFGPDDQRRLRDLARDLKARGVQVLLSNSWTPATEALFAEGFECIAVAASRAINSKAEGRGPVRELLVR